MRAKEFLAESWVQDRTDKNNAQLRDLMSKIKLVPLLQHPKTKSPIYVYDNSGRYTVLVDMGNIKFPFYRSTGLGGKEKVEVDKWYPFFGVGPDGWINKGSQDEINNYYGSSQLKSIAEILNSTYPEPARNYETVAGWNGLLPDAEPQFVRSLNQGISPASRSDDRGYLKNKADMLAKVNAKSIEPDGKNQPVEPTLAYGDKSLPDGKFMLGGIAGQVMNNIPVGPVTKYMFDLIRKEIEEKKNTIEIRRELKKYLDSAKLPSNITVNDLLRKFGGYFSDYKNLKDHESKRI